MYSIIIPAYNEEKRLGQTLQKLHSTFMGNKYEIIVVNDGSTDGTADIVTEDVLINLPVNIGKGAAIREGLKRIKGNTIIILDADMPTTSEEIIKLCYILCYRPVDIVIGSRRMYNSDVSRSEIKKRVSWIFGFITRTITGLDYQDTQCGVKVLSRRAIDKILPLISEDGYLIDIDILYAAKISNLTVREEGILWMDKAGSKVNLFRDSIRMALGILRVNKKYRDWIIASDYMKELCGKKEPMLNLGRDY